MKEKLEVFIAETRLELSKVTWPDRKRVWSLVVVVLVIVFVVGIYVGFVDFVLRFVLKLLSQLRFRG